MYKLPLSIGDLFTQSFWVTYFQGLSHPAQHCPASIVSAGHRLKDRLPPIPPFPPKKSYVACGKRGIRGSLPADFHERSLVTLNLLPLPTALSSPHHTDSGIYIIIYTCRYNMIQPKLKIGKERAT